MCALLQRHWLQAHGVVKTPVEATRDDLIATIKKNYFTVEEKVWDSWETSALHQWLVEHDVIKSTADLSREKYEKLVGEHYPKAKDTLFSSWSDSDLRQWLIEHECQSLHSNTRPCKPGTRN